MDNLTKVFGFAGLASTILFVFLEVTGVLKKRWVQGSIGILSVLLYAIAAWIYAPRWYTAILVGSLIAAIFVLYVVSYRVKKVIEMIQWHWPITFGHQQKELSSKPIFNQNSINDQKVLEFYERQKENWKSNLRLRIIRIMPVIDADVPKVIFQMEMVNYLPIEIKLVKVIRSSGNISASTLGSCELPALPETIEEKIPACSEKDFSLQMEVGKTNAPNFLRAKLMEPGRLLQWTVRGEWYIEIEGEIKPWLYKSAEIMYNQVIERQQ